MMQTIRDRAKGIVIWIIVGLIIVTFATFGLESYLSGTSSVNAANVNGTAISESAFLHAYQQEQTRLQSKLGKNYRPNMINAPALKRQVLEQMIQRTLLLQLIKDAGFRVAPQVVGEQIRAMSAFKNNGKFSKRRYVRVLRNQGMNEQNFEQDMTNDIMIQDLINGVSQSAFVTKPELATYEGLLRQRRDVEVLSIPEAGFLASAKVNAADIKAYYDKHRKDFVTPERVSIRYIKLSQAAIANQITVSDAALHQYYTDHIKQFVTRQEERQASHILIKVDKQTTAVVALKEIEKLRKKIEAGASFSAMARKYSQDTFSAKKGGDLGYLTRGVMPPTFDKSLFQLKKGQVSKPVLTRFGYHLIQLEAVKPAEISSFDQVEGRIRHDVQLQKASMQFYKEADQLTNLSYEYPDSLDFVAKKLGLKEKKTALFGRQGAQKGLAANPKVVAAAFSDEVLNQGLNSDALEVGSSTYVVVRLAEHKRARPQPLAVVSGEIEVRLRQQWARHAARVAADKALRAMDQGKSPKRIAAIYKGARWLQIGFIGRSPALDGKNTKPIGGVLREMTFRMPKPVMQKRGSAAAAVPSRKAVSLPDGSAAVLVVSGVQEGSAGVVIQTKRLSAELAGVLGKTGINALLQDARVRADVSINQKMLNGSGQ